MCNSLTMRLLALLCAVALSGWLAGCSSSHAGEEATVANPPALTGEPAAAPALAPISKASLAYPDGYREHSVAIVEKAIPAEILAGQAFDYQIVVTNTGVACLHDMMLTEEVPAGYKFTSAEPTPQSSDNGLLRWALGEFAPKEVKTFIIHGSFDQPGSFKVCTNVTYTPSLRMAMAVVQPKLTLSKMAPSEVVIGQPIPLKLIVANAGSGMARNVRLTDTLPEGMTTQDGKNALMLDAGNLAPGQSREFTAMLRTSRAGHFDNKAMAAADGGLSCEAVASTWVQQPVLALSKTAPAQVYLGRNISYELTVTNNGDAAAQDTMIIDPLPRGASLVSASDGGAIRDGKITWSLGTLQPKEARKVTAVLSSATAGAISNSAVAQAKAAEPVTALAQTNLMGVPGFLAQMADLTDPVEVGNTTTYLITLTNQGSAAHHNIKIVCTLDPAMQYVSSEGATQATLDGATLTFAPLAELAPKANSVYKVTVKAMKAADARMSLSVISDELQRPAEKIEPTTFYE